MNEKLLYIYKNTKINKITCTIIYYLIIKIIFKNPL